MLWPQVMVITRWIHSPKDEIVTFVANYFTSIGSNMWHFKDNVNVVFKFPSVRNTFFNSPNSKSTCLQEFFFVIMNQLFSSRSTSLDPLVSAKPRMWVGQKVHCFFWFEASMSVQVHVWSFSLQMIGSEYQIHIDLWNCTTPLLPPWPATKICSFPVFFLVVLLESIFGENNWSNHLSDKIYPTSAAQWETWNMCATHASNGLCHCLY